VLANLKSDLYLCITTDLSWSDVPDDNSTTYWHLSIVVSREPVGFCLCTTGMYGGVPTSFVPVQPGAVLQSFARLGERAVFPSDNQNSHDLPHARNVVAQHQRVAAKL
jgi:hypothetical protein